MTRPHLSAAHREQWRRELAPDNAWQNPTVRRLVDLGAAVAIAAVVLDALLTYVLLDGSVHLEKNPIVESAMRAIGIAPTLTLGALLRFGIVSRWRTSRPERCGRRCATAPPSRSLGRVVVVPGGIPQRGGGGPPVDGGLTVTPRS